MAPLPYLPFRKQIAEAVGDVLRPSARRCGEGLLTILEALIRGRFKGPNQLNLDYIQGVVEGIGREEEAKRQLQALAVSADNPQQRRLAQAAVELVPSDRLMLPPLPIAGKIFTYSEFDETEPAIWELWKQLLARTCDSERVLEAHPSYPWVISQLSSDEARLADVLSKSAVSYKYLKSETERDALRESINAEVKSVLSLNEDAQIQRHIDHIEALGLIYYLGDDWDVGDDEMLFYVLPKGYIQGHIAFSSYGNNFMGAISDKSKGGKASQ